MRFSFALPLLAALTSVSATISQAQYNKIVEVSHYAKVAYCMGADDDETFSVGSFADECSANSWCEENPSVQIIATIEPDMSKLEFSGTAYVAVDNSTETIYVAFRGSESAADWLTDFTFIQCPYAPYLSSNLSCQALADETDNTLLDDLIRSLGDTDACPGDCLIHCGLYVAYTQFMDEIEDIVEPYVKDNGYKLVVTGHSLGGGYAGLAGADFQFKGFNPLVITFAALKQGNQEYNAFVDGMFGTLAKNDSIADGNAFEQGTYVRVYSELDIVPCLPPGDAYTNGGLQFELMSNTIQQTIDQVDYNGPSNNDVDDSSTLNFFSADTWAIDNNHNSYFVMMGSPCSDSS